MIQSHRNEVILFQRNEQLIFMLIAHTHTHTHTRPANDIQIWCVFLQHTRYSHWQLDSKLHPLRFINTRVNGCKTQVPSGVYIPLTSPRVRREKIIFVDYEGVERQPCINKAKYMLSQQYTRVKCCTRGKKKKRNKAWERTNVYRVQTEHCVHGMLCRSLALVYSCVRGINIRNEGSSSSIGRYHMAVLCGIPSRLIIQTDDTSRRA